MSQNKKQKTINISQKMVKDVNDLVLERMFKNVYLSLSEEEKQSTISLFSSADKKAQEKFISEHIPNFKDAYKAELEEVTRELKSQVPAMANV